MNALSKLLPTLALLLTLATPARAETSPDWIYLDLGEVIVTGNPTDGYKYVPGALDLLKTLREAGYKLALMSNIPESWGVTCEAKFEMLKSFLGDRLDEEQPFDWTMLDLIVLPPYDRYRKPHKYLFTTGLAKACPSRAMFIGESQGEVDVAKSLGLATYHKGHEFSLPDLATVKTKLETEFTFEHPAQCDFASIFAEVLLPADVGMVAGCKIVP